MMRLVDAKRNKISNISPNRYFMLLVMKTTQTQLLTVQAAADVIGLSVWTLRAWAYAGKVSSVKLGKRLLIPQSELDRLVSENTRPRLESVR
jgi:excisionase family DNA binding protein